jgi:ABC-type multidrug transport system fused ATPase/permease subunit
MFLTKKIKTLIGHDKLNKFNLIVIFTIFIAIIETAGIGMVIPLVNIILNPEYLDKIKVFIPYLHNFSDKQNIVIFLIFLWLIFIIKNIMYMFYIYISNKFNQNIRKDIAQKLYFNFINQKYNFHLNISSVELVKNINIDLEDLRFSLYHFFIGIAEVFITICLIVLLLSYDFISTSLIIAAFIFVVFLYNIFLKKTSKKMGEQIFETMTHLQRHVKETLSNIKLIKIFSSKSFFEKEFNYHNTNYVKDRLMVDVIVNAPRAVIESTVVTLIVFYCFFSYTGNNSSNFFSSIGLYGLAFFRLMPAFNRMITAYSYKNILLHNTTKLYNIFKLSQNDIQNKKKINNEKDILKIEKIKIDNISFSYDKKKILENINLNIENNNFVGIVGESGAGKSTLLNLLLGLLKPDNGKVIYNNKVEIFENLELFNKKISYVPQNITILERSIKENIAFGVNKEDINLNELDKIIKKTKLNNLIDKMENGLESIINNDNLNISGGELQRIGLARALYFDSDLLILDEATNSLDVKTEKEILEMIYENFLGKKIIIFITHKIKNLEKADFIIEIKDKKIKMINKN